MSGWIEDAVTRQPGNGRKTSGWRQEADEEPVMARRWLASGRKTAMMAALCVLALILLAPTRAEAFGTIDGLGQRREHERITRAALACPAGTPSTGDCFEPKSIDQVAGKSGTFGAVGAPDSDEVFNAAAHCDDADFLSGPYPRTRAQATEALLNCVRHLRNRFNGGVNAASGLLDTANRIRPSEVNLSPDCTFILGVPGRAKCNVIEGFGRALHGAQDFYAHSNWADERDATRPVSPSNPPGLNRPAPTPVLDLRGSSAPAVPPDLTTGCFTTLDQDPGVGGCASRVTHAALNKDNGLIDPVSGSTADPITPRGRVLRNFNKAVQGAIVETRRQWRDFRAELASRYGSTRGSLMICALTRDDPLRDC